MSGNDINNSAYNGITSKFVHASLDKDTDSLVKFDEAKKSSKFSGSIFSNNENIEQTIEEKLKNNTRLNSAIENNKQEVIGTVKKYMGSCANLFNKVTSSFQSIGYTAIQVKDSDNESDAQAKIDEQIENAIQNFVGSAEGNTNNIEAAIKRAISLTENQYAGDADASANGTVKGKQKGAEFGETLERLTYNNETADGDAKATVAFYSSAQGGKDAPKTQGYKDTTAFLEANGAKTFTREVNGEKQTIFVFKDNLGNKRRVVVDDAGQMHDLEATTTIGKNTYITADAKDALNLQEGEKVKRRKVDGQYQNVVMTTTYYGDKTARVADYNSVTGEIGVTDGLQQDNAGGRAKFSSSTSGLSAYVNSHSGYEFVNGQVKTGTRNDIFGNEHNKYATTQNSRGILDANGLNRAIHNIQQSVQEKGGSISVDGNIVTVQINGHSYPIDKTDYKSADKMLRLISNELNKTPDKTVPQDIRVNVDYTEDGRIDANETVHGSNGDNHEHGHSGVKLGVSLDNGTVKRNGAGTVHSLKGHYNDNLTRAQFRNEGWYSGNSRTKEKALIEQMDSEAFRGSGKHVRNLKNSSEFAERLLKTQGVQAPTQSQIDKLAKAIQTANPSLFDSETGAMYKNADFARLNLPRNFDRYKNA